MLDVSADVRYSRVIHLLFVSTNLPILLLIV